MSKLEPNVGSKQYVRYVGTEDFKPSRGKHSRTTPAHILSTLVHRRYWIIHVANRNGENSTTSERIAAHTTPQPQVATCVIVVVEQQISYYIHNQHTLD